MRCCRFSGTVIIFCLQIIYINFAECHDHKCGYESCPRTKENMLNVHLVAHTHDDVGWLKTVDQYYYGSESLIQKAGVQYIIDSVVTELLKDPNKRFIYVESAFFFKWWREQSREVQDQVTMLVNEGRLEFIGGAWSMNDEATTHYQSVIDQFAWGLRKLNDTFGKCGRPVVGWQIDPFGHSREMASLFAQMGFDGLFFGRLDYQDKDVRLLTKKAEMIWRSSANLEPSSSHLFTGALYNQYQPPPGFCFDILCADDPIIDGKHSPDNNVKRRIDEFLNFARKMSKNYRTKNILITMGDDFHYQNAHFWFKNLDKLIKYANERQINGSNINLLYSTPSCYLKALHNADITWPTKDDDFFPYASDPHAYWTGYFTSRPTLKRFERVGNHFLQVCKQLTSLALKQLPEFMPHLSFLKETMGIMQHHDAVAGTEKEKVAFDYAKRLTVGICACGGNTKSVLNQLITKNETKTQTKADFKTCLSLNISSCYVSEFSDRFIVTLYNPLAHSTFEYVRVPVPHINYIVSNSTGVELETQFVPVPKEVQNIKHRRSRAEYDLIFLATDLPPLGYKNYYVEKAKNVHHEPVPEPENQSSYTTIGNKYFSLIFDTNGFLTAMTEKGTTRSLSQEFLYYESSIGNNLEFRNRSSGAYILRPKSEQAYIVTESPKIIVYKGNLVEEVHQKFNDWISQVVRLYRHQRFVEFEWLIGPIPIDDHVGKEIITRFTTDIQSNGNFFTDSNGREMVKRLRNHRDTWNLKLLEFVAGNYYPITTKIALEDENTRLAILTDRAQGGSSLSDGSLEIMIHRRLLHDDGFGVDEALNETAFGTGLIARGKHILLMGNSSLSRSPTLQSFERFAQVEFHLPTWKFFSNAEHLNFEEWLSTFQNTYSGLPVSLPKNVHLLTLEPWHENEMLVRFEHLLEKDEDPVYSKPIQFDLKEVLNNFFIEDIKETSLDGSSWLHDMHRMNFVPDPDQNKNFELFAKSDEEIYFLKAKKPLAHAKFHENSLYGENLGIYKYHSKHNSIKKHKRLSHVHSKKFYKVTMPDKNYDTKYIIELQPMQIRTFVLFLKKKL